MTSGHRLLSMFELWHGRRDNYTSEGAWSRTGGIPIRRRDIKPASIKWNISQICIRGINLSSPHIVCRRQTGYIHRRAGEQLQIHLGDLCLAASSYACSRYISFVSTAVCIEKCQKDEKRTPTSPAIVMWWITDEALTIDTEWDCCNSLVSIQFARRNTQFPSFSHHPTQPVLLPLKQAVHWISTVNHL